MLLSIIIPVYNVEQYLRECLDSVFVQDLAGCEVIIVNDGSTDGSPAIIKEYQHKYPELVKVIDKANGGLSSARNAGIESANGNYIYFIDSDDYLRPNAIATILDAIAVNNGNDVFYFDCIMTNQGQRRAELRISSIPSMALTSFIPYTFSKRLTICSNAFSYVYSRPFINKHSMRYTEGIKYEDTLFKYQLFDIESGSIKAVHIENPFYVYRVGREGSLSTSLSIRNFKDKEFIRHSADNIWSSNPNRGKEYYHMLYNDATYMFYEAYCSGYIKHHKKYWSRKDLKIIRKGVSNKKELGLWILLTLWPKWMARYYANDLSVLMRRATNVFISTCIKFIN